MYLDDEKTEGVIDWENPAAARALTKTLLAHDFGLQWDIPIERLCPPVSPSSSSTIINHTYLHNTYLSAHASRLLTWRLLHHRIGAQSFELHLLDQRPTPARSPRFK